MFPPDEKASYVQRTFDAIVPHYDLMNRIMSGGRDEAWRRLTARQIELSAGKCILDVAAGTADLSMAIAKQFPAATVYALDFSLPMLVRGKEKADERSANADIHFTAGDALRLPFPDETFDAVTSAFLMRNVSDIEKTFAEMARVTVPGGRVICLEISKPTLPVFRNLFWWYFTTVVPAVGRLISRHTEAYAYLPESLAQFVGADELKERMGNAGLRDVTYRRLMLGTMALHVGRRRR
jgi:demethylmenaquinone methyltransferase / 2-methoxy-6-polyprenyl-1,4-benzoquinol methylase